MMFGRWNAMFQLFGSRMVNLNFCLATTRNYTRPFLSPLSFFEVDDTFVGNDTLTNKPNWVKRDPQGVPGQQKRVFSKSLKWWLPQPCQHRLAFVVDAENIVGIPLKRKKWQIALDNFLYVIPEHLNTWVSHEKIKDKRLSLHSFLIANQRPDEKVSSRHLERPTWKITPLIKISFCLNHGSWNRTLGEAKQRVHHFQIHQNVQHLEVEASNFDVDLHLPWRSCPQLPNTQ